MDAAAFRAMALRCRDLLQIAVREEIKVQLHQWAEEFEAQADSLDITDRDDAEIVASVAEGFLRRLGREAPQHLRTEETRAERHGDTLSAEAWRDIANTAERLLH
ncbi:MAG: hypothetical protein ACJ8F3_11795 [Xanthobacteraceae bacterium]